MSELTFTPIDEIPKIVQELRTNFLSGLTRPLAYRKEQLKGLHNLIAENEALFLESVNHDLRKPAQELILGETGGIKNEAIEAIKHLDKWAAPEYVKTSLMNKMYKPHVRKTPLGTVLIIGAWNLPINLLLAPAVGAIAAGNCVILKPSEISPHTAALLTKLLPKYLDPRSVRIINGAAEETTVLLEQKFDHMFYTGSGNVGKIVMTAAAKQLTPVTLELGGKSPAFVSKDVSIPVVARRIAFGKLFNTGQACIAPDYLIVERGIEEDLVKEIKVALQEFYGDSPQKSRSYGRIVNKNHFNRLKRLLDTTRGKIVIGGEAQEDDLYIAPTVVLNVSTDDSLMESEIFGPILPIWVVDNLDEGINHVNRNDQPLALYVYSNNTKLVEHILENTRSGGVVVNDSLIQFMITSLPFGGTGPSGIGNYHGKRSFDIFSHERATVVKNQSFQKALSISYPPYTEKKTSWLEWLLFDKAKFSENAILKGKL
ncbi:Aldehyde dehydrogenase [Linnemannia zychae]|nr:Aldehyde dehydrogenase [Linnemannia zychae]